jgi:hypothetical protein
MFTSHLALVSQTKHVTLDQLAVVAAAIQKQVSRDFRRYWNLEATVNAFGKLKDVPVDYWHVVIRDDIKTPGATGVHKNESNGQPYALVQYDQNWSHTVSHECLEMLADPQGNRLIAGDSVKKGQGRVQYLVEVCDPSERAEHGYSVNGVLVADFYTPAYFDPVHSPSARYSYTGAITRPRQVLEGGYLSWLHPPTRHMWQMFVKDGKQVFADRGALPTGFLSLRAVSDRWAESEPDRPGRGKPADHLLLFTGERAGELDLAHDAEAASLQQQIDAVLAGDPDGAGDVDVLRHARRRT